MVWSVTEFVNYENNEKSVALVPDNWFTENNKKCFWPPYISQIQINKAICKKHHPKDNWSIHDVGKILYSSPNYRKASDKLSMSTVFTDVDDTGDEMRKKRHARARKQSVDYSSESEILTKNVKIPVKNVIKFPTPPISCQSNQDPILQAEFNVSDNLSELNKYEGISGNNSTLQEQLPDIKACASSSNYIAHNEAEANHIYSNEPLAILERKYLNTPRETDNLDLISELNIKDIPIVIEGISEQHCSSSTNFETEVLKKLKVIKQNQTLILDKINQLEKKQMTHTAILHDDDTSDSFDLPLKHLSDVEAAEKLLENKIIYKKMVKDLRCIGGHDLNSITNNVLKRLLSNSLCANYSLRGQGQNSKSRFTDLQLYKVTLAVVRYHKPEKTEKEIDEIIGRWLTGAKLRCLRDEKTQQRKLGVKRKLPILELDDSSEQEFST